MKAGGSGSTALTNQRQEVRDFYSALNTHNSAVAQRPATANSTYHLKFLANCLTGCLEKFKINQQRHLTWGKTGSG